MSWTDQKEYGTVLPLGRLSGLTVELSPENNLGISKTVKPNLGPNLKVIKTVVNSNPIPNLKLSENMSGPKRIVSKTNSEWRKQEPEWPVLGSVGKNEGEQTIWSTTWEFFSNDNQW